MTERPALSFSGSKAWLARHARAALGGLIVAGVVIMAAATAAVLAFAVLTILAILAVFGGLLYLFARLRRRTVPAGDGLTLEARRTGAGWRVDALGRFGG
jgi:hypothetical protein